jgi:hypothetical protein
MTETYVATLEDLLAREAIRDCIYRFCHGIDRRDRDTLRPCWVDGDSARVETYWHVFHREPGENGAEDYDYIAGGRYLDRFERRNGEWRILTRMLVRDWYQVIEGTGDWSKYIRAAEGPHGSGKESDPVRGLFGTLGGSADNAATAYANTEQRIQQSMHS